VPAGINQTDLARMLAIEAPTLTRLVKLLEDEGWVTRRPLPGDARCKMVRLTAKAKKTVTLIEGEVIRLRAETVGRLTPSQLAAGFDAMQALQRHLDEV
jgi:MarR family transcriptional regulator for hemolysin